MKQDSKSPKSANKSSKKTKKIVNRNYFARAFRFLGRILLFVSILSCIGTSTVTILQLFEAPAKTTPATTVPVTPSPTDSPASVNPTSIAFNIIITAVIILGTIAVILFLAYKYNDYARSFISWISRKTQIPVHYVELILPVLFWTTTVILLIPTFPIITIPLMFAFILNEFSFIIAWLAYGCPIYQN